MRQPCFKRLGLTGGIGMGKSTVARMFAQRGLALIDSDQLARQLVEPGQPALAEIQAVFGSEVIDTKGCLRRGELARRVFADASLRRQLEAILHPRIRQAWLEQAERYRQEHRAGVVVDIPLLFETQAERLFDRTLCVACSKTTQLRRLRERGWTDLDIARRQQAQWPVEQKMASADYVVWTEPGLDVVAAQVDRIIASEFEGVKKPDKAAPNQ